MQIRFAIGGGVVVPCRFVLPLVRVLPQICLSHICFAINEGNVPADGYQHPWHLFNNGGMTGFKVPRKILFNPHRFVLLLAAKGSDSWSQYSQSNNDYHSNYYHYSNDNSFLVHLIPPQIRHHCLPPHICLSSSPFPANLFCFLVAVVIPRRFVLPSTQSCPWCH